MPKLSEKYVDDHRKLIELTKWLVNYMTIITKELPNYNFEQNDILKPLTETKNQDALTEELKIYCNFCQNAKLLTAINVKKLSNGNQNQELSISDGSFSQWINDQHLPTIDKAIALAYCIGVFVQSMENDKKIDGFIRKFLFQIDSYFGGLPKTTEIKYQFILSYDYDHKFSFGYALVKNNKLDIVSIDGVHQMLTSILLRLMYWPIELDQVVHIQEDNFQWPIKESLYADCLRNMKTKKNKQFIYNKLKEALLTAHPNAELMQLEDGVTIPAVKLIDYKNIPIDEFIASYNNDAPILKDVDSGLINFLNVVLKKNIQDLPVFKYIGHDDKGIEIGCTNYATLISQCDTVFYKLILSLPQTGDITDEHWNSIIQLPFFKKWQSDLSALINGETKDKHFGMACTTAVMMEVKDQYGNADGLSCFGVVNSAKKNAIEEYHSALSFMYQPGANVCVSEYAKEAKLKDNIIREFAEEILGIKEADDVPNSDFIYTLTEGNQAFSHLMRLWNEGKVRIYVNGLYFDLLRLRPELSTIMFIDEHDFHKVYRGYIKNNWESSGQRIFNFGTNKSFKKVMQDSKVIEENLDEMPIHFVASGLVAIYKAYEHIYKGGPTI